MARRGWTGRLVVLAVAAVGILGLAAGGCSREPGPEVWVIGLDGADWDQLDPMIARGELPNLAQLRASGAAGILRSDMPMISPILWTSIATGKTPDVHGVTWFMTDGPDGGKMPVSSLERKVRSFWTIASDAGLDCGIVGWWATWPADPLKGWLVSDYVGWHSFGVTGRSTVDQAKTWPPELITEIEPLLPAPADIPDALLQKMVHLPPARLQADPAADPYADPAAHLRQAIATSRGYTDIVLHQLAKKRPQLLSVYYEGTDAVTHLFGDYQEPRLPWVSDEDFAAYKDVLNEYWKWQDELVGELLAKRGPHTTVFVVSDHGFRIGDERRKEDAFHIETADEDHMPDGVIIVNGPDVAAGARIANADIYDVAPTVLHALGLAVGSDMHGRVLTEAFAPASLEARPVEAVATWETAPLERAQNVQGDRAAGENLERMLKSLGYIGGGSGGGDAMSSAEQVVNLGTVLMRQNRIAEAVAKLREGLAANPGHQEIRQNLAQALARTGEFAEAQALLRGLVDEAPARLEFREDLAICLSQAGDDAGALQAIDGGLAVDPGWQQGRTARGWYLHRLGRDAEAQAVLAAVVQQDPRDGRAHFYLGEVLATSGDLDGATAALTRAHELDPADARAAVGLAGVLERQGKGAAALATLDQSLDLGGESALLLGERGAVLLRAGRVADAVAPLERARELDATNADVAGNLGMAYAMSGRLPDAVRSFEDVVRLEPDLADGHAQLGALYAETGRDDLAVRELETALAKAPGNAGFALNLGTVHHRAGRVDEARRAYRRAVELDPQLAGAWYNLGLLERSQGNPEGQQLIDKARRLDPALPAR